MEVKIKKVKLADSLWAKTWGVMFWKDFGNLNGLLLTKTNAIHTFLVFITLDLVFLDENYKVVSLVRDLRPFRISPVVLQAKHTLEMPEGQIDKLKIKVGDTLDLLYN